MIENIPLNQFSPQIPDKYADNGEKPLPCLSDQKLNEYIIDRIQQYCFYFDTFVRKTTFKKRGPAIPFMNSMLKTKNGNVWGDCRNLDTNPDTQKNKPLENKGFIALKVPGTGLEPAHP